MSEYFLTPVNTLKAYQFRLLFLLINLFLLSLFSPSIFAVNSIEPLVLSNNQDLYMFDNSISYIEDTDGTLSLSNVQNKSINNRFKLVEKDNLSLGYTKSIIWLKFSINNLSSQTNKWLLVFDYPLLDKIEIFSSIDQLNWRHQVMGDSFPFDDRFIKHRLLNKPLEIQNNQHIYYYIRVETASSMQLRPSIISEKHYFDKELRNEIFYGVIYGIMLLMAVYNLFLYIAVRELSYLAYIFSVVSGSLFIISLNGHGYQYLWPDFPIWATTSVTFFASVWLVFTSLFTQMFLETKRLTPRFYFVMNLMVSIGIILVIYSIFGDYQLSIKVTTAMALINSVLILLTSILCWVRGNQFARFFVAAWSFYGLGTVLLIISRYGMIDDNFVTHNSAALGLLIEVIMLSLALSDKYRVLTNELKGYMHDLEDKVELRTRELEMSNIQLEQLSNTDALTKMANRRYFEQEFKINWNLSIREKTPLSLLLCDADEFKSINDHFGHKVGDECLILIAKAINDTANRPGDFCARIGGDEFIILLLNTDITGAKLIGEKVCKSVAQANFPQAPGSLHTVATVSIGSATMVATEKNNQDDLFNLSDESLYQAKNKGRNCVVAMGGS